MDILLQDKGDGAEVVLEGGDLKGDGTLYNSVYLSLFGGDCFFNVYEEQEFNREFEEALNLPITVANLKTIETKANESLKWMIEKNIAYSIECYAYGNQKDQIEVEITIKELSGNISYYAIVWENQKRILRIK